MITRLIIVCFFVAVASTQAWAGFGDGMQAFRSGDYTEAAQAWQPLATAGHTKAQNNIAYLYSRGLGVKQDLKLAFEWYTRAAEQEYAIAQYNLALLYLWGKGVARSKKMASVWLRRAAANGHSRAQVRLAEHYANGTGVSKDISLGYAWLVIAGEKATGKLAKQAEASAAKLGKKMSSEQHSQAGTLSTRLKDEIRTASRGDSWRHRL